MSAWRWRRLCPDWGEFMSLRGAGGGSDARFLREQIEPEKGFTLSPAPAVYRPGCFEKPAFVAGKKQLIGSAVILPGETGNRFRRPFLTILRGIYLNVEAFLFRSVCY